MISKEDGGMLKDSKIDRYLFLILIFTFIISGQIRYGVLGRELGLINYVVLIIMAWVGIIYINRFNKIYIFLFSILTLYFLLTVVFYEKSIGNIIVSFCSFVVPTLIIGLKLDIRTFENFFRRMIVILNIVIITITILAIVDYLSDYKVMMFISRYMSPRFRELINIQSTRDVYRMYSFMGHPLFNTQLYLSFFITNMLYCKYYKKILPKSLVLIISILGIAMTASKSGFILFFVSIILFNGNKIKIKYYFILFTGVFIAFKLNIFDNIITRFMDGSLTSGRSEIWNTVSMLDMYPIKVFVGYGNSFTFYYNKLIPWASAAFEYPIRMFSLELGVINAVLIYLCIFIYPMWTLLKEKNIDILLGYIIIFIDINTYNGLSTIGDNMLVFSIFTFTMLNLSRNNKK